MTHNGLHPVSFSRHGHRSWRRFSSYAFARHRTHCPIVETEIFQAAATFPVAFRDLGAGPEPVALLSMMPEGASPFVSDTGAWLAAYVPSALRCPPFQARQPAADGCTRPKQLQLMVDETLGLVSDAHDGEPFFDKSGRLSPELEKVRAFYQARSYAANETRRLCQILGELGLFSPLKDFQGVRFPDGFLAVNTDLLGRLSQAQLALLTQNNLWRLIHAHQMSLLHGAWVLRAQQRLNQLSPTTDHDAISDVTGFLDAMADAQQLDAHIFYPKLETFDAAG